MTIHRASCTDCPWTFEDEDLIEVSDELERHSQKEQHHVDMQRAVATDGGKDLESEWALDCTDCEWDDEFVTEGHPSEGPPREVEESVREHKASADWSHVVRVEGRRADQSEEIDPSLLTDGGLPPFDRFAQETCTSCGDRVAIRFIEDGECVGCRDGGAATEALVTDGGQTVPGAEAGSLDLTAFQRNILVILSEEPMYGLAIKRQLEDYYGTEVNHGRLYPNLDTLVELGLVEKGELDKRTNQYTLTGAGEHVVEDQLRWIFSKYASDEDGIKRARDLVDEGTEGSR